MLTFGGMNYFMCFLWGVLDNNDGYDFFFWNVAYTVFLIYKIHKLLKTTIKKPFINHSYEFKTLLLSVISPDLSVDWPRRSSHPRLL